jgi:hypothetical protein
MFFSQRSFARLLAGTYSNSKRAAATLFFPFAVRTPRRYASHGGDAMAKNFFEGFAEQIV